MFSFQFLIHVGVGVGLNDVTMDLGLPWDGGTRLGGPWNLDYHGRAM